MKFGRIRWLEQSRSSSAAGSDQQPALVAPTFVVKEPSILVIERLLKFFNELALHPSSIWSPPMMSRQHLGTEHSHEEDSWQRGVRPTPHLDLGGLSKVGDVFRHQSQQTSAAESRFLFSTPTV